MLANAWQLVMVVAGGGRVRLTMSARIADRHSPIWLLDIRLPLVVVRAHQPILDADHPSSYLPTHHVSQNSSNRGIRRRHRPSSPYPAAAQHGHPRRDSGRALRRRRRHPHGLRAHGWPCLSITNPIQAPDCGREHADDNGYHSLQEVDMRVPYLH